MKKLTALLLACIFAFSLGCALAEDALKETIRYDDSLSFAMLYPEGYTASTTVENGILWMEMVSSDESAPMFLMLVCPDEELSDVQRLNDLSEEELAEFAADLSQDWNDPTVELRETGLGSKLLVLDEQEAEMDMAVLASIYQGYLLMTYVAHEGGEEITQADIDTGIQIYTDMDFITNE